MKSVTEDRGERGNSGVQISHYKQLWRTSYYIGGSYAANVSIGDRQECVAVYFDWYVISCS